MRSEELMQNDWVRLLEAPIYCKVRGMSPTGYITGETASGGSFEANASRLSPIALEQDTILCTTFWLKKKYVFCKTVRGVAAFTYWMETGLLEVKDCINGHVNHHRIAYLHELQQQYRHYTDQELEVDLAHSKRKEYSKRYYHKEG